MNDPNTVQHSGAYNPAAGREAREYTCRMHPEVRQNHPGSCLKCGMALEQARVSRVFRQHLELTASEYRDRL